MFLCVLSALVVKNTRQRRNAEPETRSVSGDHAGGCCRNPKPRTPNPELGTLNPEPGTLNPEPGTLNLDNLPHTPTI
jgi:hypothetical protein